MNQIYSVQHPIDLNKKVQANRPTCACKNAKFELVEGKVLKVIHNNTGYWYFLDSGITIKGAWITDVF